MIDWTRVDELVLEIGTEDFGEVVEIFLEEVEDAIAGLGQCTTQDEASEKLHLIKGCAWNLGFQALGELCAAGEAGQALPGTGMPQDILRTYTASRATFLNGLAERAIPAVA